MSRLKAGVAEVEITGQVGLELAAELNARVSTAVRTPLMAKAVVLSSASGREDGRARRGRPRRARPYGDGVLAIVTLDLLGLSRAVADRLAQAISHRCGIEQDAIMLVSSHTRGAPCTAEVVGGPAVDEQYVEVLLSTVPDAVSLAQAGLEDASLGAGHAMLPHLIFNHRLMTRNMKAITAWMGVPPNEVLAPEGPIDPEFGVMVVRDVRGRPLCFLWSFAADNRFPQDDQVSADLPYYVEAELDARLGRHVPSLYLAGCGGNASYTYGLEQTADALASAIMAVQLETPSDPMVKLGYRREKMVLPIRDYRQFWSRADVEMKCPGAVDAFARELELLRAEGAEAVPTSVQAFRLGRFAVVGLPGMPFVEFALAIKQASPSNATLVAGNANDHPGYVITRSAFEHGGFESWPARSAMIGPGGGEFMAETALNLLKELWRRSQVPEAGM